MDQLTLIAAELTCGQLLVQIGERHPDSIEDLVQVAKLVAAQNQSSLAAKVSAAKGDAAGSLEMEVGSGWCVLEGQSFQTPRGKFSVEFGPSDELLLHGKTPLKIERENIMLVSEIQLPNEASPRLLIPLRTPVAYGKAELKCLLVTPKPDPKSKQLSSTIRGKEISGTPLSVWRSGFEAMSQPIHIASQSENTFKSSRGKFAIPCYIGVNDGHLLPLSSGVAFVQKPTLFVPLEDIERIELGRQASGGARNFDLTISLSDGAEHQVSNLEKDEMTPISEFVSKFRINEPKPSNGKKVVSGNADEMEGDEEEPENSSSDDDSDFSDDEGPAKKKRKGTGEESGTESEGEDSESGESDSSGSDRDSDIDDEDIDLNKEYSMDNSESIADVIRSRRRAGLTRGQAPVFSLPLPSSSSSSTAASAPKVKSELDLKEEPPVKDPSSKALPLESATEVKSEHRNLASSGPPLLEAEESGTESEPEAS
mmetsp:Transcript_6059/g.11280  ORF Transcript_6059/g.11280 Transcript_6059/m.11280 type:complete len:482 (-) Transcript_6059:151-1596(-)